MNFFIFSASLKICKLNDPNRDECIKQSMQKFMPWNHKKIENIDLPSFDPFTYDSISFNYDAHQLYNNFLRGTYTVRNVKTYGMSRGKVRSVKSDFSNDQMVIQANVFFPKVFLTGTYLTNMTFNSFKIDSKGKYNVTMKDVTCKWNIKGKQENIDGEAYMKIYQFDIFPEPNDLKAAISGLFPNEILSKLQIIYESDISLPHSLITLSLQTKFPTIFLTKIGASF